MGNDRRRNLDKGNAAQEGRCREAAEVASDAAAEGDDVVAAGNAGIRELLIEVEERRRAFMFLPSREDQAVDAEAGAGQGRFQPLSVEGIDVRVGNDGQGPRFRQVADIIASPVEKAIFNMDIIRVFS